jgi:hypothetical protein
VSQVILRRFAAPHGKDRGRKIACIAVRHPYSGPRYIGARGCGKVSHFVRLGARTAELFWKQIEDLLPEALAALDRGSILAEPRQLETIKDALALHFVRSIPVALMSEQAWSISRQERYAAFRQWPAVAREFYRRKGFYAAGPEMLDHFLDEITEPLRNLHETGAIFRARLEDLYAGTRDMIRQSGIEILRTRADSLIISDAPALTVRRGFPGVGVHGGVPLGRASSLAMPFGPRCIVALSRDNQDMYLTQEQTNQVNTLQLMSAVAHVYYRPGTGQERFIRSALGLVTGGRP